jgi:hypothetical protein
VTVHRDVHETVHRDVQVTVHRDLHVTVHRDLHVTVHRDLHVTVHRDKFLYNNQPDAKISQIYLGNETRHVSDSSSVHHQELFTVHTAMVYVIQVCRQLSNSSRIRMELQFEKLVHLIGYYKEIYSGLYGKKLISRRNETNNFSERINSS